MWSSSGDNAQMFTQLGTVKSLRLELKKEKLVTKSVSMRLCRPFAGLADEMFSTELLREIHSKIY